MSGSAIGRFTIAATAAALVSACGGGDGTTTTLPPGSGNATPVEAPAPTPTATAIVGATPTPVPGMPTPTPAPVVAPPSASAQLQLPAGFAASIIANVSGARELAALPSGDLLVGTLGSTIAIVPQAEAAGVAGSAVTFTTLPDDKAASVVYGPDGNLYAGTDHGVWRIGYTSGATAGGPHVKIATVRGGAVSPNTDGDNHSTTSVAISGSTLFAGVGSDCDACTEVDPTRASVQQMGLDGSGMSTKAKNYRNVMALAVDPSSGAVWGGGAGQDKLAAGHPYETLDAITSHPGVADYGWPQCYDNRTPVNGTSSAACSAMTTSALVFPAYATLVGATFYSTTQAGTYAFPAAYRGLFVTWHGSWHTAANGLSAVQPQVVFVPFASGLPVAAVNWNDPTTQSRGFFTNFGTSANNRIGRPTGIAVGSQGSLFVADDQTGNIYRIRPLTTATQAIRRRRT